MDTWLHILSMALALFLLMDSIGNVPIFSSILKDIPARRQKTIIFRELIIALAIILLFAYLGDPLLRFLNVKLPTIQIAGGIILFLMAIKMIFPTKGNHTPGAHAAKEPMIVPLATPLIAGPAVLAAVMLYSGQESTWALFGAIIVAWIVSTAILLASSLLKRLLKERGLIACERLMGLILTLIAVQMFLEGLDRFLHPLV